MRMALQVRQELTSHPVLSKSQSLCLSLELVIAISEYFRIIAKQKQVSHSCINIPRLFSSSGVSEIDLLKNVSIENFYLFLNCPK